MVEVKNLQQQENEGKLPFHSRLMLMSRVLIPWGFNSIYPPE